MRDDPDQLTYNEFKEVGGNPHIFLENSSREKGQKPRHVTPLRGEGGFPSTARIILRKTNVKPITHIQQAFNSMNGSSKHKENHLKLFSSYFLG